VDEAMKGCELQLDGTVEETSRGVRVRGRSWGSRVVIVATLAILVVPMIGAVPANATRPVWHITITASCSGVSSGYVGNPDGNLRDWKDNVLELDGIKGYVFWGVSCPLDGSFSTSFTTFKQPTNAVVGFDVFTTAGALVCTLGQALPPVPGTATLSSTTGCPEVASLTATFSQPVKF
jgi:hypothetical protein